VSYNLGVWSERELGDWEACVISSYLEGLVYGGVTNFPKGVYTQAERETLEKVPDEPQDYATTDLVAQARYGVHLRKVSVATLAAALARVGVGLVLAGYGSLNIPTSAPIHSVFYVPTSSVSGLVFDPLAPNQSAGVATPATKVLAWAKGPGANDAREVMKDEFAKSAGGNMPVIEKLTALPKGSSVQFVANKQYQFFWFDPTNGARSSSAWVPKTATAAGAEALVDLTGEGPAYFLPKCFDGSVLRDNMYLPIGYVGPNELYTPPAPSVDCSAEVKAATDPLKAELDKTQSALTALRDLVKAHNDVESKMGAVA